MKDRRRDLQSYRRASSALKAKAKRHGLPCSLCREPFDWTLPYHDRMAFTADHVVPLDAGGAILGPLRPAHRACNSKRGNGSRETQMPTTRQW